MGYPKIVIAISKMEDPVWKAFKVWLKKNRQHYRFGFVTEGWSDEEVWEDFFSPTPNIPNASFTKNEIKSIRYFYRMTEEVLKGEKKDFTEDDILNHKTFKGIVKRIRQDVDNDLADIQIKRFNKSPERRAAVLKCVDVKKMAKSIKAKPAAEQVLTESLKSIVAGKPQDAEKTLNRAVGDPETYGIQKGHLKKIKAQLAKAGIKG